METAPASNRYRTRNSLWSCSRRSTQNRVIRHWPFSGSMENFAL